MSVSLHGRACVHRGKIAFFFFCLYTANANKDGGFFFIVMLYKNRHRQMTGIVGYLDTTSSATTTKTKPMRFVEPVFDDDYPTGERNSRGLHFGGPGERNRVGMSP